MFEQLVPLLHIACSRNILTLFAHLLHERRVIFCATTLSVLSSGVQSTLALLYPFSWQHVLVPVLPEALLSFCCAPMPFVVGVLSQQLQLLQQQRHAMEDVVVFDLDKDCFLDEGCATPRPDDLASIPQSYRAAILDQVDAARNAEHHLASVRQGKRLARPFLAFFVQMFWNYRRFVSAGQFDKVAFLESKSPTSRPFLADFVETQMSCQFFQELLQQTTKLSTRCQVFETLTNFVDQQFQAAIKEIENSNPRERFKRRMSKILPFNQVRKGSVTEVGTSPLSMSKVFAAEQNRDLEIVKKPDQVSGFGLPLSTMSRKTAVPSVAASDSAAFDPKSLISPFKIRGQIEPGHSPNIFSPTSNFDEEMAEEDAARVVQQHSERFLSQFFETSAIEHLESGTISFASACGEDSDNECDDTGKRMSLAEEMSVMARLIQESWTGYGGNEEEQLPLVTSPSSPYHTLSYERYGLRMSENI